MLELEMFPARDGDALVVTWGDEQDPKRMLIDAGRESGWSAIKAAFRTLPENQRTFELLVVTHIDADHIAGVLKMLADPGRPIKFKEIWFNAYHHLVDGTWESFGPNQGEALSDLLQDSAQTWNHRFDGGAVVVESDAPLPRFEIEGLELTLLSPTRSKLQALIPEWKAWLRKEGLDRGEVPAHDSAPTGIVPDGYEAFGPRPDVLALAAAPETEDQSAPNGSAIAFAIQYGSKRILLGADAHPSVLTTSISALPAEERRFDLVKLSHHGSKNNLSRALLNIVDCRRFAVSTDGSRHHHPDAEAIARIISFKQGEKHLHFNYRHQEAAVWDNAELRAEFLYNCYFASEDQMGRLRVSL